MVEKAAYAFYTHVWVYQKYMRDESLLEDEAAARDAGLGLWTLPEVQRVPPWEWRRKSRQGGDTPNWLARGLRKGITKLQPNQRLHTPCLQIVCTRQIQRLQPLANPLILMARPEGFEPPTTWFEVRKTSKSPQFTVNQRIHQFSELQLVDPAQP